MVRVDYHDQPTNLGRKTRRLNSGRGSAKQRTDYGRGPFCYTRCWRKGDLLHVVAAKKPRVTVGRSEYVDLPEWGIADLLAKVDTGARTSALHVEDLERLPGNRVAFHVIVSRAKSGHSVRVEADVVKWARVRSSSGHYSTRCFVRTRARLGAIEKEIELSLDSRDKMNYRMLLGRKALAKDFVVDVAKQHALRKGPAPLRDGASHARKQKQIGEAP